MAGELWDISQRELLLLESLHRNILCTILGSATLVLLCISSSGAFGCMFHCFLDLAASAQFSLFLLSYASRCSALVCYSLTWLIVVPAVCNCHLWSQLLGCESLSAILELLTSPPFYDWYSFVHCHVIAQQYVAIADECSGLEALGCCLPIANCPAL